MINTLLRKTIPALGLGPWYFSIAAQYFDPAHIAPFLREICSTLRSASLRTGTYGDLLRAPEDC